MDRYSVEIIYKRQILTNKAGKVYSLQLCTKLYTKK